MGERIIVGTAGHIDHGKSALVYALTGTDPDRLPEEKERGITIELGFAHAAWDGITFSFVDVPGHEKFVRTMVAGAQGIDVALLAVASDDSVMPQTREHLEILKLLGVGAGVIARTKSDLVDAETGAVVEAEIRDLVAGSFLERAPLLAVSSVTGAGLPELKRALAQAAWRAVRRDPQRSVTRLFLDRAFAMKGFGPVVTGTLVGGRVSADDRLTLLPEGLEVRVRRVEVHGEERRAAEAGERTSLNLAGVEVGDLKRGQTLAAPGSVAPSSVLTVELSALASASGPLTDGMRLRIHHGTAEAASRLSLLGPPGVDGKRTLAPGATGRAQLFLQKPLAALRNDHFVVRRPSPVETLGGGRVLDTYRKRIKASEAGAADALGILAAGDESAVAALFLRETGPACLDAAALAPRLGVPAATAAQLLQTLQARGEAVRVGSGLYGHASSVLELARRAESLFADRKRTGAPTLSLPRGELLERVARGLPSAVAEGWLALLHAAKKLAVDGDRVGPPGTGATDLAGDAAGFAARIAAGFEKAAFDPPKGSDLARLLGTKPAVVDGLVTHLLKIGVLVRLSPDLVVHRAPVEAAAAKLESVKGRTLSVADFRDLLGLTRKSLIPLLEHFDRMKKTVRKGDVREVC